jgi:hypothetical protein
MCEQAGAGGYWEPLSADSKRGFKSAGKPNEQVAGFTNGLSRLVGLRHCFQEAVSNSIGCV